MNCGVTLQMALGIILREEKALPIRRKMECAEICMKVIAATKLIWKALRGQEDAKFFLAERVSNIIYPRYKFAEFGRLYLYDQSFLELYERLVGTGNYHSLDRKYVLDQLVQQIYPIQGDSAECGVYEGASSYLMCRRLVGSGKCHHVFDSFVGLSVPCKEDGPYWQQGALAAAEAVVRRNLSEFDFVRYHPGWIPDRFHEVTDLKFSFVHIDVDLYQPTLDSARFFYERLNPGGIMLCDDYGFTTCPGAKQAMDSFLGDKPEKIVHLPTGQGFIVKLPDQN
jgi:O-methyltransferase